MTFRIAQIKKVQNLLLMQVSHALGGAGLFAICIWQIHWAVILIILSCLIAWFRELLTDNKTMLYSQEEMELLLEKDIETEIDKILHPHAYYRKGQ